MCTKLLLRDIAVNSRGKNFGEFHSCKTFIHDNLRTEQFVLWERLSTKVFSFKFPLSKPKSSVFFRIIQIGMTQEAPRHSLFPQSHLEEELATLLSISTGFDALFGLCFVRAKLANKKIIALTELTGISSIFGDANFLSLAACEIQVGGVTATKTQAQQLVHTHAHEHAALWSSPTTTTPHYKLSKHHQS